jgi:curved DNA-binding protein CbpA
VRAGHRNDPFRSLGLAPAPDLGDDDIRAAWRRVAAATHPDRADGGDPAVFAAAAAAYTVLRTPTGRGEALADLADSARRPRPAGLLNRPPAGARSRPGGFPAGAFRASGPRLLLARVRRGRPLVLLLRLTAAAAAACIPVIVAGWQPASFAILAGAATWLAVTGRSDLAPPP